MCEARNPEQVTLMIAGHYRVKDVVFDYEYGRTFVTVEPDTNVSAATELSTGLEKDYWVND